MDWAIGHGLVMGKGSSICTTLAQSLTAYHYEGDAEGTFSHAPFTLQPTKIPQEAFEQVEKYKPRLVLSSVKSSKNTFSRHRL